MFLLRLASVFLLASSTLISATPVANPEPAALAPAVVEVDKRASISSITNVLNTLEVTVGNILPQIDNLVASGTAISSVAVSSLVLQLTAF